MLRCAPPTTQAVCFPGAWWQGKGERKWCPSDPTTTWPWYSSQQLISGFHLLTASALAISPVPQLERDFCLGGKSNAASLARHGQSPQALAHAAKACSQCFGAGLKAGVRNPTQVLHGGRDPLFDSLRNLSVFCFCHFCFTCLTGGLCELQA